MLKSHLEWLRISIINDIDMSKRPNFVALSICEMAYRKLLFLPMNRKPCSLLVSHDGHV